MSILSFRAIQRLINPTPINAVIADGDRVDEALNKLQGQINEIGGGSIGELNADPASPTPNQAWVLRSIGSAAIPAGVIMGYRGGQVITLPALPEIGAFDLSFASTEGIKRARLA